MQVSELFVPPTFPFGYLKVWEKLFCKVRVLPASSAVARYTITIVYLLFQTLNRLYMQDKHMPILCLHLQTEDKCSSKFFLFLQFL